MTAPDLTASRATIASTARITLDRLEGACDDQRVMFQEIFPNGFEATSEAECVAAARKHASDFDWGPASKILLADPAREAYEAAELSAREAYKSVKRQAWEAYEDAMRPAREAYEAADRSAWKTYKDSNSQAWKTYKDAKRSARESYKSVKRPAWKAYEDSNSQAWESYEDACAGAFARAFWAQESTQ